MTPLPSVARGATVSAALLLLSVAPAALEAQSRDYRLGAPTVSAGIHGGWGLARGGSELFDFTREQLTVGSRDLDGLALRGEVSLRLADRADLALGAGWSGGEVHSEFRDWVDQDELPIEQTTWFNRVPLTLGGKLYLTDRGRRVSRFAWIPAGSALYVGGGVGMTWYRFRQKGAFVNTETLDVFDDDFVTEGWGPTAYVAGGADFSLNPRAFVTTEARYVRGSADVGTDFQGFDRIELGGWQLSLGISVR
jgi:hypothetical protein